jgi:hypothetical protein
LGDKSRSHAHFYLWPTNRVARWVCEKIVQNVAQYIFCQNQCIILSVKKVALNVGHFRNRQNSCPK